MTTALLNPERLSNHAQAEARSDTISIPRRILIVEDEDDDRRHLHSLLAADRDIQIESTSNARDALSLLDEKAYSIVLTDLRLPGLDGMEFIQEIQRAGHAVTIIIMTGDST